MDALDIEQRRLDQAAALARENDVQNVQFHLGSAYQLPFPDNTFDVVFEHMVLMHLSEPTVALKEAYRVLKPGGIFGGRDADWGGWLWGTHLHDEMVHHHAEFARHFLSRKGSNYLFGRHLAASGRAAGFEPVMPKIGRAHG